MRAIEVEVAARLLNLLRLCRDQRLSFEGCMRVARARHNREVREQAIAKALQ